MIRHVSKSKKARVAEGDISVFDFEMELEEEAPRNTFNSGSSNYFFSSSFQRKPKLPVTTSALSSVRQVQQSAREKSGDENQASIPRGKSGDENQVSTSGRDSKQGMSRNLDTLSHRNEVVVTASRGRLGQHYGRFVTVIFTSKHIEVKQAKDILSRKWNREDLCVLRCFYKFHSENADEKAIVVLQLHKPKVSGGCPRDDCTNPDDLSETFVMEIGNELWKEHQRNIFNLCEAYRAVWKRIDDGKELLKYKGRLTRSPLEVPTRSPLEELSNNGNLRRKTEPESPPEMFSPPARLSVELHTFETLVYPRGDPDAVTITSKDFEILRPMGFLNDTIIDFYIKYLQEKLSEKDKERFYFFNSFFFRKLVDSSKKCSGSNQCKVAYERVRKWTRKVKLFQKDYVFIPVNQSLHWSLIVVCHLGSLGSSPDECRGTPCILHLDSMKGNHAGIEDHIRNYILQAWIEEHQSSAHDSLEATMSQMKYIEAKVPQQHNHCDCGTYLLHYVELFLKEAPPHFSLAPSQGFPYFLTRNWFKSSEASAKRRAIRNLLMDLCQSFTSTAIGKEVTSSEGPEDPLILDEEDICISSDSKVIDSDIVVSLQKQVSEELQGAGNEAAGIETPSIVDLCSNEERNEATALEYDLGSLIGMDDKLCLSSSSTSAALEHSDPLLSPPAVIEDPAAAG